MITVFYDGKCGLCSKEINHYRKIAPENIFEWQDITESAEKLENEGITFLEGMKLLHVIDDKGFIHVGVDGFIVIWKRLKRWRMLARFAALPLINPLAKILYSLFAEWRFKRIDHCQLAAKQISKHDKK